MKNPFKVLSTKYKSIPLGVRASFLFLICGFLQRGIAVITTPIFTRLLSTSDYGSYSIFNSWLSIFTVIIPIALPSGVYAQGLVKFENDKNKFTTSLLWLGTFLVILWSALYFIFSKQINSLLGLSTLECSFILILIWTSLTYRFWETRQRIDNKYNILIILTIIVTLFTPLLSVIFVLIISNKVIGKIIGILIPQLLLYVPLFFLQITKSKTVIDKSIWKYALVFNLPLVPHYISQSILNSSDRIMIGKMIGESEAGIYSLASAIAQLMRIFDTALTQVIDPWTYKKIKNNQIDDISVIAYISLFVMALINLVLILFAPEILILFAPKEYQTAIWVIPPIAMSTFFIFAYNFFADFEFYFEKTRLIATATIFAALLNILLNFIFIPIFGYYAAAYTTLFCYIAYALFHYIAFRKICKKQFSGHNPYNPTKLLLISIGFILLGFSFMLSYKITVLRIIIILCCFIVVFLFRKKIFGYLKEILLLRKNK